MEKKMIAFICPLSKQESETRKRSDDIMHNVIEPIAKELNYKVERADKKYGSLNNELKFLSHYNFIKCNQSCIVSLNKIRDIHHQDVILINDEILHMSRNYINKVIIAFSQH